MTTVVVRHNRCLLCRLTWEVEQSRSRIWNLDPHPRREHSARPLPVREMLLRRTPERPPRSFALLRMTQRVRATAAVIHAERGKDHAVASRWRGHLGKRALAEIATSISLMLLRGPAYLTNPIIDSQVLGVMPIMTRAGIFGRTICASVDDFAFVVRTILRPWQDYRGSFIRGATGQTKPLTLPLVSSATRAGE